MPFKRSRPATGHRHRSHWLHPAPRLDTLDAGPVISAQIHRTQFAEARAALAQGLRRGLRADAVEHRVERHQSGALSGGVVALDPPVLAPLGLEELDAEAEGLRRHRVEAILDALFVNPGPVDGVIDDRTSAAIGLYAAEYGFAGEAVLSAELLQHLERHDLAARQPHEGPRRRLVRSTRLERVP